MIPYNFVLFRYRFAQSLMESFLVIIVFLFIGLALKSVPVFPKETGNVLNMAVIYVSLPSLILLNIPSLNFSNGLLVPIVMPWVMLLFTFLLILILSSCLRLDRSTTGCLLLLVPLGNTSFLGIPMVKVFFGEEAVSYALLYDQFGSFLALAIYGSLILAIYGPKKTEFTLMSVIKKVILFPPFIALMLALVLRPFTYPEALVGILETLAATLVPFVMLAVGLQMRFQFSKEIISQLSVGLGIKLIVAPLVALFFCKVTGLEGEAVKVSIFEAGMPPMVSAAALAILANLSPALAAALVGIGIILSFATLPMLHQLIAHIIG